MGRACGMHGRYEICIHNFVGKPEGKRPLERPTCRWEDNIRMDFREVGWEGVVGLYLTQNRDH